MKKISVVFMTFVFSMACTGLFAQQHMGGMGKGRHMGVPAAKGQMLQVADKIVHAVNTHNVAELQKMLAPDAVYLDEDGHAPPARAWVHKLTMGNQHMTISSTHSQMWGDAGWVSFNYELKEEYQGKPLTLVGTADVVCRKEGGMWKIQMVHGALKQTVPGFVRQHQ